MRKNSLKYFFATGAVNWTVSETKLAPGFHRFEWEYYKDSSFEQGEDRAVIQNIRINGLTIADLRCLKCSPGTYQPDSKQTVCLPCQANTYSATVGATECKPCPGGQASFPGAKSCYVKRACTAEDLTWTSSGCDDETMTETRTFNWISPPACDTSSAVLPVPEVVPCTPRTSCYPGQTKVGRVCEYCPASQYSDGSSPCQTCTIGMKPTPKVLIADSWGTSLPQPFSTSCSGACTSPGWRPAVNFVDSGSQHGPSTTSTLTFDTVIAAPGGTLSFDVKMSCDPMFKLAVLAGTKALLEAPCTGCGSPMLRLSAPLAAGAVSLNWVFRKGATLPENSSDCDAVRVYAVNVTNLVGAGGSSGCISCPAGTAGQSGDVPCATCLAGTASKEGSTKCDTCQTNTFSKDGFGSCVACGTGTTAPAGSGSCQFTCDSIPLSSFSDRDETNSTVFSLSFSGHNRTLISGRNVFSFTMCGQMTCKASDPSSRGYLCQSTYNSTIDDWVNSVGDILTFQAHPTSVREGFLGLIGSTGSSGACLASVLFQCDKLTSVPGELAQQGASVAGCPRHFLWRSRSACRKCTVADYGSKEGPCQKGIQETTFFWLTELCEGGVALPDTLQTTCQEKLSLNKVYIYIGVGVTVLLVAAAAGAIGFLVYKNRKIYNSYKRLQLSDTPLDGPIS